jgi:hypothetical protein
MEALFPPTMPDDLVYKFEKSRFDAIREYAVVMGCQTPNPYRADRFLGIAIAYLYRKFEHSHPAFAQQIDPDYDRRKKSAVGGLRLRDGCCDVRTFARITGFPTPKSCQGYGKNQRFRKFVERLIADGAIKEERDSSRNIAIRLVGQGQCNSLRPLLIPAVSLSAEAVYGSQGNELESAIVSYLDAEWRSPSEVLEAIRQDEPVHNKRFGVACNKLSSLNVVEFQLCRKGKNLHRQMRLKEKEPFQVGDAVIELPFSKSVRRGVVVEVQQEDLYQKLKIQFNGMNCLSISSSQLCWKI